ncbi:MAG: hypothetical protein U5R31_03945 [Acidimicrobiia bacterium]|nr:hypothetical protein [Acidimicrobiia bacterium]
MRAARRAAAGVERGRPEVLDRLASRWIDDPVFAATFLRLTGPGGLLGVLARLAATPARDTAVSSSAAVMARLHATAVEADARTLRRGCRGRRRRRRPVPARGHRPAGRDVGPAPHRDARAARRRLPGPRERPVRRGEIRPADLVVSRGDDEIDVRAAVLTAVSRDPGAATAALDSGQGPAGPLDLLLPAWTGYADDGAALGAVVVAGTAPGEVTWPAAAAFADVAAWVGDRAAVAGGARRARRAAVPTSAGSVPTTCLARAVDDPLPALPATVAIGFLEVVARHPAADAALRAGALGWATRRSRGLAGRDDPRVGANEMAVLGSSSTPGPAGSWRGRPTATRHATTTVSWWHRPSRCWARSRRPSSRRP